MDGSSKLDSDEAQKTIQDQKKLLCRIQEEKDDLSSQLELLRQQVFIIRCLCDM